MRHRRYTPSRAEVAATVREEAAAVLAAEAIVEAQRSAREACAPIPELPWTAAARVCGDWAARAGADKH